VDFFFTDELKVFLDAADPSANDPKAGRTILTFDID